MREVPAAAVHKLPAVLPRSEPAALVIRKIGLAGSLIRLGRQDGRTLQVPPGEPGSPAGWYVDSPAPGSRGPAVILGHVNSTAGTPGVFGRLYELAAGDEVRVRRQDGTAAVFRVYAAEKYAKDAFPSLRVYGNTERAELRLITCDGYNAQTGKFDENLVVYASLVPD